MQSRLVASWAFPPVLPGDHDGAVAERACGCVRWDQVIVDHRLTIGE